ncbi:ATP-binding cassette domain-containing protein [Fructobacillus ficulneus]|uniref:Putative ATP-binding protein n=1 Tax=Fructobacillus ficulneus TaxID=157463 RepID=A0A0K8MIR3_9LACO|nr:ABC transporter ATP-binding protein [Fructobacillus ficulneus]GAP00059.1 putative ATP-binding protein [Fructobacillus ficulneus]
MQVKNCDIQINYKTLVYDASFTLVDEQVNLLIGNNGVGKTVILDQIANLDNNRPAGFLEFPDQSDLVYQTQGVPFIDEVSVQTVLTLFEQMAGANFLTQGSLPNIIEKNLQTRYGNLSGGEKRFVMIWATLQIPRKLYLFDEPLANLDPYHTAEVMKMFYAGVRDGKTIVLTTHQFEGLESDLTHVVHISDQKIAFDGSLSNFTNKHGEDLAKVLQAMPS